jgi:hypothetical protein
MSGDEMSPEWISEDRTREMEQRALDARIVRELERVPALSLSIPADFAARVAAKVPERKAEVVPVTHYGRTLIGVSLVVLLVALVVLAARGFVSSPIGLVVQWSLCTQFLVLAVWMGTQRLRSN